MSELVPDVRTDEKMLEALRRIAPGTTMRQGINDILRGDLGALIVIGEPAELSFLFSGGIRLDQAFSPYLLYELAKMDGAVILNAMATRIVYANVQLMPDPTIPSAETGTRHRTAERVAKQTDALVISISQQRSTISIFVGRAGADTRGPRGAGRVAVSGPARVRAARGPRISRDGQPARPLRIAARLPRPLAHSSRAGGRGQEGR